MKKIVGILLAAGASRRFGSDKLTRALPGGTPIAIQACRHLLAGSDEVIAVIRPGNELLAKELTAEGASVAICVNADSGMGISLAFGVETRPEADGWLIALADMPWIKPSTICLVSDTIRSGALISAPAFRGRRGHPVGFSRHLRDDLIHLTGDTGAKKLIQSHRQQLHLIECDDAGIHRDVDFPEDLIT
ncbi:MAG: nucleotidyltransferase family protein [Gammaproteobacteria bacterium]